MKVGIFEDADLTWKKIIGSAEINIITNKYD